MNISETSGPIAIKFYLKHHLGGGNAALGFELDQNRTLVSMAIDSSHRVINEFLFCSVFLLNIIGSSSQSFSMLISFLIVL